MRLLLYLLVLVRALSADRARLALDVAPRQQLNVLKRSMKRARINAEQHSSRPSSQPP